MNTKDSYFILDELKSILILESKLLDKISLNIKNSSDNNELEINQKNILNKVQKLIKDYEPSSHI